MKVRAQCTIVPVERWLTNREQASVGADHAIEQVNLVGAAVLQFVDDEPARWPLQGVLGEQGVGVAEQVVEVHDASAQLLDVEQAGEALDVVWMAHVLPQDSALLEGVEPLVDLAAVLDAQVVLVDDPVQEALFLLDVDDLEVLVVAEFVPWQRMTQQRAGDRVKGAHQPGVRQRRRVFRGHVGDARGDLLGGLVGKGHHGHVGQCDPFDQVQVQHLVDQHRGLATSDLCAHQRRAVIGEHGLKLPGVEA
jgi:hypothetical protein